VPSYAAIVIHFVTQPLGAGTERLLAPPRFPGLGAGGVRRQH
jgi:hypothetical protein